MARCLLPAVLLLSLAAGPLAAADTAPRVPLPGESTATGRRLDAADKLAADKDYPAAAEEYVRILEEAGDDLVAVGDHLIIPARRLCQLRLAALPPADLRSYRTRVDPQAKRWLEEGAAERDVRPLERLVDEAFCSRPADAALDLLGDLAFERGHFYEAERWWRMLALPAPEAARRMKQLPAPPWLKSADPPDLNLLYPDPQVDVARARAKQVLALLFRGETEAARAELEAFRALHPKAQGHLAGRQGNYADILQAVASRPIPAAPAEDAWPTFAGAASRGAVLPAERSDPNRLNRLVADGPAWRYQLDVHRLVPGEWVLPAEKPGHLPTPYSAAERARHLPFHPVILGRQVLVADARRVTALDAATGDSQTWDLFRDDPRLAGEANGQHLNMTLPAPADLRYTLTVADGRIYARLGAQGLPPPKPGAEADSFLVCLEVAEPGHRLKEVWLRPADPTGKPPRAMFEGAPVVRDGLLHVAATRFENGGQTTEIRCYSADSDAPPRWKQDVVTGRDLPSAPRYRHQLLTLAGRYVVYASHAGAVAALDARTGRRAWTFRYPSTVVTTPAGNALPRDLAPAVYADGRLYVAPADYDRLLCLDVETGSLLWERERVDVVHLLGVGSGRLIFTTPKGIRAVRAAGGDDGGWQMPDDPGPEGLPSYGRGFLAGDCVFWPTRSGVQVLSQVDGRPPIDLIPGPLGLHHLTPGNLAYADGILAVADRFVLKVYRAPAPESAAPDVPGQAVQALARQADALAASGRPAEALAAWQRILAEDALRRGVLHDARRLPQTAAVVAADRIDALIRAHGRALYAPTEAKARALLASAKDDAAMLERLADDYPNAAAAGPALRQLAKAHEEAGRWGAAARAYRSLLRCETTEEERKAALTGLSRAVGQERRCFPPGEPSDLTLPLIRSWEKEERLLPSPESPPAAEVLLVRGAPVGQAFQPDKGCQAGKPDLRLVCREAATGAERWARPVIGAPSWVGRSGVTAVVGGPGAVQGFALSDGTPLWQFSAPEPAAFRDPRLSAFQLAGGRCFCLQGECRLLALDAESGRVLWQNWAPAARLTADVPGCRFSPHYLATDDRVLIQSAGRCRLLDARTGSVVRDRPTDAILWVQPPLPLGAGRVAIVNARQAVTALDLLTGGVVWAYQLPRRPSLSGEPPRLFGDRDGLLIAVPRNAGYWLQRLDPSSGRAIWEDEVPLGPDQIDPASVALDRDGVYFASRGIVRARALVGGGKLWSADVALPGPAGRWALRRAGAALLAWPAEARREKFHSRWLTASLELDVTFPPEDRSGRGIPVLLLDPQDGRAVQRLNLLPPAPRAQGRLASDEELTAWPGILSARAAAEGPVVSLTREGLVIGWDRRAWAMCAGK